MIIILETVTLALALCAVALGYEMPPSSFTLYGQNAGEYSVTSGDCNSADRNETAISCNFARVEIFQPPKRVNEATQIELDGWEYGERPNPALANRLSEELNHIIPIEKKGLKDATDVDRLKKDLALHQEWLDDLRNNRPFLTDKDKAGMSKIGLIDEKQNTVL